MLLNIYLGTTAINWITVFIFSVACGKKLKRDGYKFVKEKKSISEKIASFISVAFKGSIPVYNILNVVIILCMGDKLYEYMENKLLEDGKIYMPTEEVTSSENETSSKEESNTAEFNTEIDYFEQIAALRQEREYLVSLNSMIQNDGIEEIDKRIEILEQEARQNGIDDLYLKREKIQENYTFPRK